jgi:Ger(x)C family germination protein
MIRLIVLCAVLFSFALLASGCGDRRNLEDLTISLILGLDLDDRNNMIIYESSPVFDKMAKDKEEEFGFRSTTFREAQAKFDSTVTALTVYGKTEVILVGKKLLEHKEWSKVLDHFYRDSKMSVTAVVVAVDGPVSEIVQMHPADKPRLPLFLSKLIDTANRRSLTVKTTLQEFRRQMSDRGMTATISEIRKRDNIEVFGTALLDGQGNYAAGLSIADTTLLNILRKEKRDMSLNLKVPAVEKTNAIFNPNQLTMAIYDPKVKVKTDYIDGRFRFDLDVRLTVRLLERLFPYDVRKETEKLERLIGEELQSRFEGIIDTIQKQRIDPVGFGIYARAYRYKEWKQVQERWGEALAAADVNVTVKAKIKYMGAVK